MRTLYVCDCIYRVSVPSSWPGVFCQFNTDLMGELHSCIRMRSIKVEGMDSYLQHFYVCSLLTIEVLVCSKFIRFNEIINFFMVFNFKPSANV